MVFLRKFLGKPKQVSAATVPPNRRVYAIGDIHGRADLLRALLSDIYDDADGFEGATELVFLGDYVDRGEGSQQVLELCLQLEQESAHTLVFLRGNHEAALLDFIEHPSTAAGWLGFGGLATLLSYGVGGISEGSDPEVLQRAADELSQALPPSHIAFLESLQRWHRVGDYFFCHAGINLDFPLEQQPDNSLFWGEGVDLKHHWPIDCCVVHGHHIRPEAELSPTRIGIDTGAYFSGCLTAVCLEGNERRLLQTNS